MKQKYRCLLFFLLAFSGSVSAQHPHVRHQKKDTSQIVRACMDSLRVYRAEFDSISLGKRFSESDDVDGRYYRLFVPLTFYHSIAANVPSVDSSSRVRGDVPDAVMLRVYLERPDLVISSESRLRKAGSIRKDIIDQPIRQNADLVEKVSPVPEVPLLAPMDVLVKKPNFWTFGGDSYLQFLQNYVSENWHKGGESNYSMVANLTVTANYNNKSRIKFENKLELKLGFQTSQDDTIHKFKTNNDLVRYTGKVGLQAANKWYYTLQLLAYTQFSQGLKSNDKYVYSDFMSPFNLNLGLGMDYAVETKNKRLKGNINLSFLSFNFRYVDRKDLAGRYGVIGDHYTKEDFGSQLTADLTWNITDQVKWKTRLYGYTTYERAQIDWENTITLTVSKYISTNIFIYPRFDDAGNYDDKLGFWQFKEYCSLGFSYSL